MRVANKQTVGLLMGIYNEAERIKECLDYHLPYVEEVVIVIQKSDDGTEEVVREYMKNHDHTPMKILYYPKMGCSEATLQFGADELGTDWILYVDADEKFPKEFLEKMHDIIETNETDGFWLERDNYFTVQIFNDAVPIEPKTITIKHPTRDRQFRLTRKSMSWFPPQIHVRCRVRGPQGNGTQERTKQLDYAIYHHKSLNEQWIDNLAYVPAVRLVNAMEKTKHGETIEATLMKSMDKPGSLLFANIRDHIPFPIETVFFVYDVPEGAERGHHANRTINEVIFCIRGSVKITTNDGYRRNEFHLTDPYNGLFVKNMTWTQIKEFSPDAILAVVASGVFTPSEQVRDFDQFIKELGQNP
jgi:glycosyltransferase involved in cell wall biosynthesis